MMIRSVTRADALEELGKILPGSIDMIYVDPPFNTGKEQVSGRTGISYTDSRDRAVFVDWCYRWIHECHRVLKPSGSLYVHLDERMAPAIRIYALDPIFGEENRLNTVIWAYDYGGRGKDRWPNKHDVILVYVKEMGKHVFNWEDIDRIPYMAPGLQKDPARAERGKCPTDVQWMSVIGTNSKERVGYPTQKPVKLIERFILASCPSDGIVLDCFCGSGTTAVAAKNLGRSYMVSDVGEDAIRLTRMRLGDDSAGRADS